MKKTLILLIVFIVGILIITKHPPLEAENSIPQIIEEDKINIDSLSNSIYSSVYKIKKEKENREIKNELLQKKIEVLKNKVQDLSVKLKKTNEHLIKK